MAGRTRSADALITLASRSLNLALGFVASVATARLLAPELRGEYGLFVTVIAFVPVFANLGLAEAIVYFFNRGDADVRRSATSVGLGFVVCLGVTGAASVVLVPWLAEHYFPIGGSLAAGMALGAGVAACLLLNSSAFFQAQRRFLFLGLMTAFQPAAFVAALGFVWWWRGGFRETLVYLFASWVVGALLAFAPLVRWLKPASLDTSYLRRLFRFSLKSYANAVVNQVNYRVDLLLVGYLLPDLAAVAAYHVATAMTGLIWVIPDSYGQIVYPRLAAHHDERARTSEAVQGIRIIIVPVVMIAAALAVAGPILVPLVFGRSYESAVALVWILLPGIVAMSISKILTRYFVSRNKQQLNTYWILAAVSVNVTLNFLLIPRLAAQGAALSASLAWTVLALGLGASFAGLGGLRREDFAEFPTREFRLLARKARDWVAARQTR